MDRSGLTRRRDRKHCEHCGEELSYSAYLQHRRLYYIASERRWVRQVCDDSKRLKTHSAPAKAGKDSSQSNDVGTSSDALQGKLVSL